MLAVKRHPSRENVYVDAASATHPALQSEPWLYFNEGEYTRTFEGLVVPLNPQTRPRVLKHPALADTTELTDQGGNDQ